MKKIERKIKSFVRSIDPSIQVMFHDGAMESEAQNKRIFINVDEFLYVFDDEPDHIQVMKEKGYIIDIMLPTYILLHEIGHVKMFEQYPNRAVLNRQYEIEVDRVVKKYEGIERLRQYKNLKLERDADKFAYNYYLHNYEKVKKFDALMKKYLPA